MCSKPRPGIDDTGSKIKLMLPQFHLCVHAGEYQMAPVKLTGTNRVESFIVDPQKRIDVLGDYDVIGLNTTQKRIFIIECKVLQPIGSVFEHSNQQKRFFTKEKFDEKFQKRIDYFSKVAMSFFANHGYDTEGFTINPYMVVNKVFSSYYKHVQFPIVTFDELKREIQL